ncbi:MAG: aminotransferase class IV [Deltaproteobacteria bacterium]
MIAYFNERFLREEDIRISPEDRGFLFADALYEVIRTYEGRLFETQAHWERLSYGAKALRFNRTDFTGLTEVAERLLRDNGLARGDATVYVQVTRGQAPRSHAFPPHETPLTVYASAHPISPKGFEDDGVSVILVSDQRWARCDIKTVGLTANILAKQQAVERGAYEALFVRDGAVLEGTHSNLFTVFDGTLVTPPRTNYILGGITRQVILELCKQLSIPVAEHPVFESRLLEADEIMVVGTTTEITPVLRVNGQKLRSGETGVIGRRLRKAFRDKVGAMSRK